MKKRSSSSRRLPRPRWPVYPDRASWALLGAYFLLDRGAKAASGVPDRRHARLSRQHQSRLRWPTGWPGSVCGHPPSIFRCATPASRKRGRARLPGDDWLFPSTMQRRHQVRRDRPHRRHARRSLYNKRTPIWSRRCASTRANCSSAASSTTMWPVQDSGRRPELDQLEILLGRQDAIRRRDRPFRRA